MRANARSFSFSVLITFIISNSFYVYFIVLFMCTKPEHKNNLKFVETHAARLRAIAVLRDLDLDGFLRIQILDLQRRLTQAV